MKNIELLNLLDMRELFAIYKKSIDSFVNIKIGFDEKIYILLSEHIPERIDGRFVNTIANSNYSAIILDVDWYENKVTGHTFVNLGKHKMNFHMIQSIGENILLLGARCKYNRENGPERNAVIVDLKGNVINEFCFGDGKVKWEANREICDCYAINIDEQDNLWYYYYTEFELVKTDLCKEKAYNPQVKGAAGFLITSDTRNVIFDGGYGKHDEFVTATFNGDALKDYEPIQLLHNGKNIKNKFYSFMQSKAVFIDVNCRLFVKWFISLGSI
ncbi:MAG: hypothetical protein HDT39_16135 [Lachnospiraceae bacterium]|nr:hypothetical protein [Lachnospiraceae bacterium]